MHNLIHLLREHMERVQKQNVVYCRFAVKLTSMGDAERHTHNLNRMDGISAVRHCQSGGSRLLELSTALFLQICSSVRHNVLGKYTSSMFLIEHVRFNFGKLSRTLQDSS